MGEAKGRKSIFITGAASGIGAETARHFAAKGWFCGLYDINEAGLEEVAASIGRDNCHLARLDVTNRADWTASVAGFSSATGGRMDVLFNNAGIGRHGWFEDIPPEEADRIIDINVKGVINGVYAALPLLQASPGARIVNTASSAGIVGAPRLSVYSASKWAVRGLTEALDAEFRDLGIRVTTLMPWFIDTPILDMGRTPGANEKMSDEMRAQGAKVYPVSLAAEKVWEAVNGSDIYYMVGAEAERARFMTRWLPEFLRRSVRKMVPSRN